MSVMMLGVGGLTTGVDATHPTESRTVKSMRSKLLNIASLVVFAFASAVSMLREINILAPPALTEPIFMLIPTDNE